MRTFAITRTPDRASANPKSPTKPPRGNFVTRLAAMPPNLSEGPMGGQRVESTRTAPAAQPELFPADEKARLHCVQGELRVRFGEWVKDFGGATALAAGLFQGKDYENKINDALTGADKRKVQLEWVAALILVPGLARKIAAWFDEWAGRVQQFSDEQQGRAALSVLRELAAKDPDAAEMLEKKYARALGSAADRVSFK